MSKSKSDKVYKVNVCDGSDPKCVGFRLLKYFKGDKRGRVQNTKGSD